jgi:hypothetical protein
MIIRVMLFGCCNNYILLLVMLPHCVHQQGPNELHDLLHVAFNSSSPQTAAAGLGLLQQEDLNLPGDEALALLMTAVERHSVSRADVLPMLVEHLETMEQLTVVQLLPVLLRAMELDARTEPQAAGEQPDPYKACLRLWQLASLPAFEQLSPEAVAGLLESALNVGDRRSVLVMWNSMPGVWAIDPARFAGILQAAAKAGDVFSLRVLSRAPAFHAVEAAALAAAIMPAVEAGFEKCVTALLKSRSAAQLAAGSAELLCELLLAALHADRPGIVAVLHPPRALKLKRLMPLLQAALQYSPASFMCLFGQPAADKVTAKELGQLLRWAGRWYRREIFYEVLNWHRAWGSISPEDKLVGLLQIAVQQGADCRSFCVHPCAAAVDAELTWLLLRFAVVTEQQGNLESLLLLPAAAKLSTEKLVELMMVAVEGVVGPASLSKAAASAAAPAAAATSSAAGGQSLPVVIENEAPRQQYLFRKISGPTSAVTVAESGPVAAASNGNAAASGGDAAATAAAAASEHSSLEEGEVKDILLQPMQKLSLSGIAAASSISLAVLCQWDASKSIGAKGLLQLLQAAVKCAPAAAAAADLAEGPTIRQTQPDFTAVQQLCSSKAAASITSAAELKPLLEQVLSHHDPASIEKLLQTCPAAAAVDVAMRQELLLHTFSTVHTAGSLTAASSATQ